jgi:rhodanese-related sulfurtransferase
MKGPKLLIWGLGAMVLLALAIALTRPAGPVRADVSNRDLVQLQGQGARVIDVRSSGEFALGHIEGAENVPLDQLTDASKTWDRQKAIVVYCATGSRSYNAAQFLAAQGFQKVYNLKAGIVAWDGPVAKGTAAPVAAMKTDGKPILIDFYSDT